MIWLSAVVAALLPGVALAHTGVGIAGGFLSGFTLRSSASITWWR
jgi:hypothetical protein